MSHITRFLQALGLSLILAFNASTLGVQAQESSQAEASTSRPDPATSPATTSETLIGLPKAGYFRFPPGLRPEDDNSDEMVHYYNEDNQEELYIEVIDDLESANLPEPFNKLPILVYVATSEMCQYTASYHSQLMQGGPESLGRVLNTGYVLNVTDAKGYHRTVYLIQHPDDANRVIRVTYFSENRQVLDNFKDYILTWTATQSQNP